ncbi:MAG: hypothetical protein ACYTG0_43730 [Planctomycetota bacterium]|jgi:hypothetical protein
MTDRKRNFIASIMASVLSTCGCGQPSAPAPERDSEPTIVEEISVSGFDPDGEPVIKKWSDGSIWIHFEAMPPFFSEDDGTEAECENFETKIEDAIGVPVRRDDREVFVITNPQSDTATRAKAWLESYRNK